MAKPVVLIDNRDSFTFNIVEALVLAGASVTVVGHDEVLASEVLASGPVGLVIGPGPFAPAQAGISLDVAARGLGDPSFPPILGVCLGHQALAVAAGSQLARSSAPRHGEVESIFHDESGLFEGLASPLDVARYNSLTVPKSELPPSLRLTATNLEGEVMAIASGKHHGIQFHPESALCPDARRVFSNWVELLSERHGGRIPRATT